MKILESINLIRTACFCTNNNILSNEQQTFVNRKSCFTNLLKTFEEWTSVMGNGFGVDVIYLDYMCYHFLIAASEAYQVEV